MSYLRQLALVTIGAAIMLIFEHVTLPYFSYTIIDKSMLESSKNIQSPRKSPKDIHTNARASLGKTKVYRFNGSHIQQLPEFCTWTVHVDCVPLKTPSGETPIHIHDLAVDKWVSKELKYNGVWESNNIKLILSELEKDPELGFMDLGSHVGAFSLSVAKFGRKVVSVDPLIENVQRLCKSIQKGGFTDRMTILFNPLGADHSFVNFKPISDNLGGTSVIASSGSSSTSPCDEPANSYTITLDDTLPYLPFKKAVLKMDIQEYEYYALSGAGRFFKEIEVPAILMEWVLMKSDINGKNLVDLLSNWNYSAYEPIIGGKKLDINQFLSWPYDVLWKKAKLEQ
ncbi:uncharacterized protein LOC124140112 [Haliotis rufescens]|uniref:uncharacterized protein LOC124140112 n=1 Tax=Haliotis rufescens TaxID=6454 RepID=UPI001EB00186|nr:uncharacterized protein LOC124140112 [Haliotis rufescens]XP_046363461.1 uncharacterized protein LOC124140112 [Haliotis rufescens]